MNEIPLKQWRSEEAKRIGISLRGVASRLYQLGKYPDLTKRYKNARVILVPADYHPRRSEAPHPGEVRLNAFCLSEMQRLGLKSPVAVYRRLQRGWYKGQVKLRRLNRRMVYVKMVAKSCPDA